MLIATWCYNWNFKFYLKQILMITLKILAMKQKTFLNTTVLMYLHGVEISKINEFNTIPCSSDEVTSKLWNIQQDSLKTSSSPTNRFSIPCTQANSNYKLVLHNNIEI